MRRLATRCSRSRTLTSATVLGLAAALAACGGGGGGGGAPPPPPPPPPAFGGFAANPANLANPVVGASQSFGAAVAWADWNADGRLDLFVGVPNRTVTSLATAGAVELFLQDAAGAFLPSRTLTAADWTASSGFAANAGGQFGFALASADFDGDGLLDLAIGSPGANPVTGGGPAVSDAGAVFFLFNDGLPAHTGVFVGPFFDPMAVSTTDPARFGAALAVGSLDPDPRPDLAVGAPHAATSLAPDAGRVRLLFGRPAPGRVDLIAGFSFEDGAPTSGQRFGEAVAVADVTGDGFGEVVAGSPGKPTSAGGEVHVVGTGFGDMPFAIAVIVSDPFDASGAAEFGASLAAGDLDGDGDDDLLAGSPAAAGGGHVVAFQGDGTPAANFVASALTDAAPAAGARFGAGVAIGDVDDDGDLDLVVGASQATFSALAGAGHVTLLFGAAGSAFAAPSASDVYGSDQPSVNGRFGSSLALALANADAFLDVAVGVPGRAGDAGGVDVLASE